MKTEVAEPVAAEVRGEVPVRSGLWKRNIKAGATQRHAYVQWGRDRVPYAPWMEFGGGIPNQRNRTGEPRVRRPFRAEGRYVHPTVLDARERAGEAAARVLAQTMARARLQLD